MGTIFEVRRYCIECGEWRTIRAAQRREKNPVVPCRKHSSGKPYLLGRRTTTTNGYVMLRVGPGRKGSVYEHRHVWEQAHGAIPPGHHVHHKNHDKADNRLENLELIDGSAHVSHHVSERHKSGNLNNRGARSGRWRHDIDGDYIVRRVSEGASLKQVSREIGASWETTKRHHDAAG